MAGDFNAIFACVGVGSAEDGDQYFVDDSVAILDACEMDGVGCDSIAAQGTKSADDGESIRATDADDAECVALVLEKNCMAANIALKKAVDPVPRLSSRIERRFYLKKYRDLKEEK